MGKVLILCVNHLSVRSRSGTQALAKSTDVMLQCYIWHSGLKERLKGLLPSVAPFLLWCFSGFPGECVCCPGLAGLTRYSYTHGYQPTGRSHFQMSAYDALTQGLEKLKGRTLMSTADVSVSSLPIQVHHLAWPLVSVLLLSWIQQWGCKNLHDFS